VKVDSLHPMSDKICTNDYYNWLDKGLSTSGKNSGLLPAMMSALKSKYDPSGGNFLRVTTSYSEIPNEKMSTYKNKHHICTLEIMATFLIPPVK